MKRRALALSVILSAAVIAVVGSFARNPGLLKRPGYVYETNPRSDRCLPYYDADQVDTSWDIGVAGVAYDEDTGDAVGVLPERFLSYDNLTLSDHVVWYLDSIRWGTTGEQLVLSQDGETGGEHGTEQIVTGGGGLTWGATVIFFDTSPLSGFLSSDTLGIQSIPSGDWIFDFWFSTNDDGFTNGETRLWYNVYKYDETETATLLFSEVSSTIGGKVQFYENVSDMFSEPSFDVLPTDKLFIEIGTQTTDNTGGPVQLVFGSSTYDPFIGAPINQANDDRYTSKFITDELSTNNGDPTGFLDRDDSSVTLDGLTVTVGGTDFVVYSSGRRFVKDSESIQVGDTTGLYYVYYDTNGTLSYQLDGGDIFGYHYIFAATVYGNGTTGLLGDERHEAGMSEATHEYLHDTVGTRFESGLTLTAGDTSFEVGAGTYFDEDIKFDIAAGTTCHVLYLDGATWTWTAPQMEYFSTVSDVVQYNPSGALSDVTNNKFFAMWFFVTNDPVTPVYVVMGQREDTTLTDAKTNNTYESLNLSGLPFKEMKVIYRVIMKRSGTSEVYQSTQDYRKVSTLPSTTYVPTDHGTLAGLSDNDHPQYTLLNNVGGALNFWTDFLGVNANMNPPWIGAGTSSGTIAFGDGELNHPGIGIFKSATGNNSGYYHITNATAILIGGSERTTFVFKTLNAAAGYNRWRMGWQDSTSSSDPTDGAWLYFDQNAGTISGQRNSAGAGVATTATTFTYSDATWYRGEISTDAAATTITYTVYLCSTGASQWTNTLTTIPTGITGHGVVTWNTAPVSAREIVHVDYMSYIIDRDLTR